VLAYVFWHRPREGVGAEAYEQAQIAFHHSLAHAPPMGFRGSAVFRVTGLPWLAPAAPGQASAASYEDWYLLEDYTAMGVLNEAAVGRGHRGPHDALARRFGAGAGGLYGLLEGHADLHCEHVVWVSRPPGSRRGALAELLGDGMDPEHASLWRRQFVLGPAPEYCLLAPVAPAGVAPTRLPEGWRALTFAREALWGGA
jgi:hypothetical protein